MAKVYHSEIYGLRETKYGWLNKHNIKNVKWKRIVPHPEFYLFIPTDDKLANHYFSFYKINEIFPINCVGLFTARDNFVIDFEKKKLERKIEDFRNDKIDDEIIKITYNLKENQKWKITEKRKKLKKDTDWKGSITRILYRPFDERWIFYHDEMIERSRRDVMLQLMEDNIAMCVGRQSSVIGSEKYNIVFLSDRIVDLNLFRRGGELVFPLYIYKKTAPKKKLLFDQLVMFEPEVEYEAILPNISKVVRNMLINHYEKPFLNPTDIDKKGKGIGSKDIFYYCYAILYSNTYRKKYAEFLKIDFPRIPFTKSYKLFIQLGKLGRRLADLHLLKSKELDKTIAKFPIKGSNKIGKPKFVNVETGHAPSLQSGNVYINKEQYFEGITEQVWNYQIGGYQVCEKWLKDRKDRELSLEEIHTYFKIVTSLSKTIEIQTEIDELYDEVEEKK